MAEEAASNEGAGSAWPRTGAAGPGAALRRCRGMMRRLAPPRPPAMQDPGSAPLLVCLLIGLIGLAVGATILAVGIPEQLGVQRNRFEKVADEAFLRFDAALDDYRVSGLWLNQACMDRRMTFEEYRGVYDYIVSTGTEFLAASCGLNVSAADRPFYENQSATYLAANYPAFDYQGFMGVQFDPTIDQSHMLPMVNASWYFVTHFAEPLSDPYNLYVLDFDMMTTYYHRSIVLEALSTGNLSVSGRLEYLPPPTDPSQPYEYSLIMAHPGLPGVFRNVTGKLYGDVAVLVLRFGALLEKAYQHFSVDEETQIYVYDATESEVKQGGEPSFLGSANLGLANLTFNQEVHYNDLWDIPTSQRTDKQIAFAARQWQFVVLAPVDTYNPEYALIIFGAVMIVVASLCAAMWIYSRSRAKAEKAAILIESAKKAAQLERELNDFIAHEVRNPLSAAISAQAFVSSAINESEPFKNKESKKAIQEDVNVIGNSLQYINDLLRSMLDFHCVISKQISLQKKHTNIRNDIFHPVASMLYHRGCAFQVIIDCPEELVIMSDPLRLKQVILNLAVNATKFVIKGFVRLRAETNRVSGVFIHVEDSGPGIPVDKRDNLFAKFQSSLDTLNQGTGIGLSLCKQLVELLGGKIYLDDSYNSGIDGCPGCRFTVALKIPSMKWDNLALLDDVDISEYIAEGEVAPAPEPKPEEPQAQPQSQPTASLPETVSEDSLPEALSVLFVDDDFILRKLFIRSLKRCRPDWEVCEAASGEAALQLVEDRGPDKAFGIIFMDQYMASTQKQLLGTETVRELRSRGMNGIICGLSANDIGSQFAEAGADCFIMKPLPCEKDALAVELIRILNSRSSSSVGDDNRV